MKKLLRLLFSFLFIFLIFVSCLEAKEVKKEFAHFENGKMVVYQIPLPLKVAKINMPPAGVPPKTALKLYRGQLEEYRLGCTLQKIFPFPLSTIKMVVFKKGWVEKEMMTKDYHLFLGGIIFPLLVLGIFTFFLCSSEKKVNINKLFPFFILLEVYPIIGISLVTFARYLGGGVKITIPIMVGVAILGLIGGGRVITRAKIKFSSPLLTKNVVELGGSTVFVFTGIAAFIAASSADISVLPQYIYFVLGAGIISFLVIASQWRWQKE